MDPQGDGNLPIPMVRAHTLHSLYTTPLEYTSFPIHNPTKIQIILEAST